MIKKVWRRKCFRIDEIRNRTIIRGVNKTEEIVEIIVQVIDNATFPLHKYVITFDAVPPGQEPRIINPRPISKSIFRSLRRRICSDMAPYKERSPE